MTKFLENKFYKRYREIIVLLADITIVFVSFFIAMLIKFNFQLNMVMAVDWFKNGLLILSIVNIYIASFLVFQVQLSLWKYVGIQEIIRICLSSALATTILIICHMILFDSSWFLASTLVLTGILVILMMLTFRLGYRLLRRTNIDEKSLKRAIVVGAGDGGYLMLKELRQSQTLCTKVIGLVDDFKRGRIVDGYRVLGGIKDIPSIVEKYKIDVVYIAIPSASDKLRKQILDTCVPLHVKVRLMKFIEEKVDGKKTQSYPITDVSIEDLLGRGEIHLEQNEIASYLTDQNVLVTGAGGSIGSELCRQIIRFKPKRLLMMDFNENGLYMLEQEFNRMRMHEEIDADIEVVSYITSIREKHALEELFALEKPDVVFHAAAHKHVPLMETRPKESIKNNVFGTKNVIDTCIQFHVKRFIMISTDKAVNPTNVMGATKRMTELLLQANGNNGVTKMAAVRFGNVLGSNGSVIPIFKNQLAEGGPLTITDKEIIRYFMTIPEAAQLVLQAGFYADKGEIFVLDMGKPVKILTLAENLIRLSGLEPYKDIEIKEIGLRPGEKMYEELCLGNEKRYKTKNDLIYVNEVMNITKEELNKKINILFKLVGDKENDLEIKKILFKLIDTNCVL